MSLFSRLILIFCFASFQYTLSIPNITACKRDDNVCFVKSLNDIYQTVVRGVPELDIKSSDPLPQELVEAKLPIISYTLTNSTCIGYSQCKFLNAEFSTRTKKLHLDLHCPYFRMSGDYEIDGNLLGVPIKGKGPYWIECKDYLIKFDADTDITQGDDGKNYINIKNFNIDADLRGGMDFDLDNLFEGQKELADSVLQFARANWKPVSNLLQGPAFNANIKKILKNLNKFLKHIPIESIRLQ